MRIRIPRALVALVVAGLCLSGCESDESAESDEGTTGDSSVESPLGDYVGEAACFYARSSDAEQGRAIREAFVDPGGVVRLLGETATVRPGETFVAAVANDGDEEVLYGQTYELERLQDGEWVDVEGEPEAFAAIGLTAAPRDVGSCVVISVPSTVEAGTLRVVMAGVSGLPNSSGRGTLYYEFEAAGAPIVNPSWERIHALNERVNALPRKSREHERIQRRIVRLVRKQNSVRAEVQVRLALDAFNRAATALDASILCDEVIPPSVLRRGLGEDCEPQVGRAMSSDPENWLPLELTGPVRFREGTASVPVRQGERSFRAELVREDGRWYMPVFD